MGGCLATIFKGGNKKHIYRPIRTGTTAKYGTNSRDQSYLGRGYTGGGDTSSGRNKSKSKGGSNATSTLSCPACGYTTQFKRDMHQHIANRHGGKVKRPKQTKSDPATDYTPGGNSGETAAASKWNDLHKSESELAAEIILREHGHGRYGPTIEKKPSRFERAKKGTKGIYSSVKSAISQHGISSGTRGVSTGGKRKKKKKKKRVKE